MFILISRVLYFIFISHDKLQYYTTVFVLYFIFIYHIKSLQIHINILYCATVNRKLQNRRFLDLTIVVISRGFIFYIQWFDQNCILLYVDCRANCEHLDQMIVVISRSPKSPIPGAWAAAHPNTESGNVFMLKIQPWIEKIYFFA